MATKYKYDKDTDYTDLIRQATARGDNMAAAIYEQQRNAKVAGEGLTGMVQTNDYAQYLPVEDVPDYDDTHRRQAETLLTERDTSGQRAMLAGKLPELAQLAYERYNGERKTRLSAIDSLLDAADSRDSVTKAQIAALLEMDDADFSRADSKLQQQAKAAAEARTAAEKKAKAEQAAAEKEKSEKEQAEKAARSDARRQIALILRNGGTVPNALWERSGYGSETIAAMLRGRRG